MSVCLHCCTGVHSGGLRQKAAVADWVRDLLCRLRDPHCSAQPAGTELTATPAAYESGWLFFTRDQNQFLFYVAAGPHQ